MKQVLKYVGYFLLIFIIGFMIWRFYYIIVWVLVAFIISFIGQPLVKLFDRIHLRKIRFPHALSALLSLLIIVLVAISLVSVFVPLIISQAETIASIDMDSVTENLFIHLQWLEDELHRFGVLPTGLGLQEFLQERLMSINAESTDLTFGSFITSAGNFFLGLFSILFIAFFFLKDDEMFQEGLLLFVPEIHHRATINVVGESKHLLIRYFIGVITEVISVMLLIALGLWLFGFENALLVGFFGGIMNIIPYIGPLIGSLIGISLGLTTILASGGYTELFPALLKLLGVFLATNFIDNNILVPLIYSKSVKSHPLEIFLVIIIAGSLGGLVGMLVAVPVYTILRVIAKEFFQQFRIVQKLTEKIN
jgi:predicted PurR-regulated permease PerM